MKQFLLLGLALLTFPTVTFAQRSPFGDRSAQDDEIAFGDDMFSPPPLFVDGITLPSTTLQSGGKLTGSFHVLSMDRNSHSDVRYRFELISRKVKPEGNIITDDSPTFYSKTLSEDVLTLTPKEVKDVPFTYTLPVVPKGDYRLRIQLTNSKSRDMGWDDIDVSVEGDSFSYATLTTGPLEVAEYPDQKFQPDQGPNITAGTAFTINAIASLGGGDSETSVVPSLDISSFSKGGKSITNKQFDPLTIDPGVETSLTLQLNALEEPGVYVGQLVLRSASTNAIMSPVIEYRWIVRGGTASIFGLRLEEVVSRKGDILRVATDLVGPADAETKMTASLEFEVIDDNGVAGSFSVPDELSIDYAVTSGIASITLTRDLGLNPKLHAMLRDSSGTQLDEYTIPIPVSVHTTSTVSTTDYRNLKMIIGVIGLICVVTGLLIWRRKKASPVLPLIIIAFISAAFLYPSMGSRAAVCTPQEPSTNGIELSRARKGCDPGVTGGWEVVGNRPITQLFINRPIHDAPAGTYSRDSVPLEFRLTYTSCGNRLGGTVVYADYLGSGGKISTVDNPAGNTWERAWWSERAFLCTTCGDFVGIGSGSAIYYNQGAYSGTLNLTNLSGNVADTTLRITGTWNWNMPAHYGSGRAYSADTRITSGGIVSNIGNIYPANLNTSHIINFWLNFASPDLSITKTGPSSVERGSDITYTVQVSNAGPGNAQNVVVTDDVPAGLTFKPSSSSNECALTGTTISCTIANIAANRSSSLTLVFGTTPGAVSTTGPSSSPSTFTFSNRTQMVDFVNSLGRFPRLVPNGNNAAGFQSDSSTATALCNLAGYTTVSSFGESRFTHPRDNIIASWNGSGFNTVNAKSGGNPKKLHSLSCSGPSSPTPPTTSTSPTPEPCTPATVQNTASVSASNPDTSPSNNSSSVSTSITCPVPPPPPAPVSVDLLINGSQTPPPTSVNTPVTLSWASTNADTCSATGDWTGVKVPNGSESTTPTQVRTYTYTITCTNTTSGTTGTDSGTIVVNALAGDANGAPVAVVGMLINGQLSTFATPVNVTQGQQVTVQLLATGSDDPDGWTHVTKGVANGGKCEWNSNLSPDGSVDTVISSPASPASCDIANLASVVGYPIVFNDPVGTYTYSLLKITDASGASSPVAQVRVTVVARTYQCNDTADNDGDGLIDTNDPGCHTDGNPSNSGSYDPTDDDETNTIAAQCSNGVDDGDPEDTLADAQDPGCHSDGNANNTGSYVPTDNDETNTTSGGSGSGGGSGGFQETR